DMIESVSCGGFSPGKVQIEVYHTNHCPALNIAVLPGFLVALFGFTDAIMDVRQIPSPFDLYGYEVSESARWQLLPNADVRITGKFDLNCTPRRITDFNEPIGRRDYGGLHN